MPKPIFLFRIRKDPTNYYYVNSSGSVVVSTTAVNITKSFPDWKKLSIQYKRSLEYPGVFRSYAPEAMQFVNDAAKILRYLFNTQGDTEAEAELEVYKLRSSDQQYYPRCSCTINFAKYTNSLNVVTAALVEGGLVAKFRAYDTTDFLIPLGEPGTDPDTDWIWISGDPPGGDPGGLMLLGNYHYQTQAGAIANIAVPSGTEGYATPGIVYVDKEGAYAVLEPHSPLADEVPGASAIDLTDIGRAVRATTVTLSGEIVIDEIKNFGGSSQDMKLELRADVYHGSFSTFVSSTTVWVDPSLYLTPGSTRAATATLTATSIVLSDGDYLILTWVGITPAPIGGGATCNMSVTLNAAATNIDLAFQFRQDDTPCRALSHWHVFRKLFHALTGSTAVDPVSDLLTTSVFPGPDVYNLNPVNTFFAPGDALRQLYVTADGTTTDPAIKTNFKDFNKDGLVINGAGIGIERDGSGNEVLRFEKLEHFFQKDTLIYDLGSNIVSDSWRMYPYDDWKANNIKSGHKDIKYDEVNGRFDFLSEYNYQTSVKSIKKDVEIVTPYHHSPWDIEYTRANLAGKPTTDSGSDNETFKIQSNGNRMTISGLSTNAWQVDKAQTITSGIPTDVQPTLFNVMFSNGRNFGRCSKWLKSIYYNLVSPILTFRTGKKNVDLVSSMYTGPVVTENANIDLTPDGTGEDILFKPWVFDFKVQVPINLPDLMDATPYGVFRHTLVRNGVSYVLDGFVLECGITDGINDVYNFKLLCSPNTVIPAGL